MTAMNLIVQERAKAAFILSDTAVTGNQDGVVISFIPKVIGLSLGVDAFVAVGTTGSLSVPYLTPHLKEISAATLPDFLEAFPQAFRAAERDMLAGGGQGSIAAVLAVFDRRAGRASGYVIGNDHRLFPPSCRPHQLNRAKKHLTDLDPDRHLNMIQTDHCNPAAWQPARDGAALLEAQRSDPFQFAPDVYGSGIGGEAVLTRVDGNGISHVTLKAWPDRVGRPINARLGNEMGWRDRLRIWGRQTLRPTLSLTLGPKRPLKLAD